MLGTIGNPLDDCGRSGDMRGVDGIVGSWDLVTTCNWAYNLIYQGAKLY